MHKDLSYLIVSYFASKFQRFHLFFLQKRRTLGHKKVRKCVILASYIGGLLGLFAQA